MYFLQTTKAETVVRAAPPTVEKDVKEWRAKMAAEKRAKIMAQMAAMQKSFLAGNAHLIGEMDCDGSGAAAGVDEGQQPVKPTVSHTCILCQQETPVKADGPALVLCALVQRSTIHVLDRKTSDKADEVSKVKLYCIGLQE